MLTLLAGVFIYITLAGIIDFQKTEGTVWERLKAAAKNRMMVLWGYVTTVALAIIDNGPASSSSPTSAAAPSKDQQQDREPVRQAVEGT